MSTAVCQTDTCSRWVKTCVDIYTHEMFDGDKYSRRDAWGWIIANAAWKPHKTRHRAKIVQLDRGQLFVGRAFLAQAWGWSENQVRVFLDQLMAEKMITIASTDGRFANIATVVNYNLYQDNPKTSPKPESPPVEIPVEIPMECGSRADSPPVESPVDHQLITSRTPVDHHTVGKVTKDRKEVAVVGECVGAKVDWKGLQQQLTEAGGSAIADECNAPGLADVSRAIYWMNNGYDLHLDILPVIRIVALQKRRKPIVSWTYFEKALVEHKAERLRPMPAAGGAPSPAKAHQPKTPSIAGALALKFAAEAEAAKAEGTYR